VNPTDRSRLRAEDGLSATCDEQDPCPHRTPDGRDRTPSPAISPSDLIPCAPARWRSHVTRIRPTISIAPVTNPGLFPRRNQSLPPTPPFHCFFGLDAWIEKGSPGRNMMRLGAQSPLPPATRSWIAAWSAPYGSLSSRSCVSVGYHGIGSV